MKMPRPLLALAFALLPLAPASAQMSVPALPEGDKAALHAEIRNYLLAHPEILTEMIAILEERQAAQLAEDDRTLIAANQAALFDDGYSFVGGNPEGGTTIVEFLDYQCGFCRRAHPELATLIAEDGDIRWIVKEFPILGPGSELAARAAISTLVNLGPDAYATLNDTLMRLEGGVTEASLDAALADAGLDAEKVKAGMQDPEVTRRIAETRALAETLGIGGTPTFVFADRMLRGFASSDQMLATIAELRAAQ
jgi:protein-disulfide isomerase